MDDGMGADHARDPQVGSLAEEAAKLLGTLKGWAHDHGAGAEHVVAEAPECTVCPLCRTLHAVRGVNPEVRSHLSSAATSLGQALSVFLSTPPPGAGEPPRGDTPDHVQVEDVPVHDAQ